MSGVYVWLDLNTRKADPKRAATRAAPTADLWDGVGPPLFAVAGALWTFGDKSVVGRAEERNATSAQRATAADVAFRDESCSTATYDF